MLELKAEEEKFRAMRNAEIRRENAGRGMIAKLEKNELQELADQVKEVWELPTRVGMEDYVTNINLDRLAKEDAKGNKREPQEPLSEKQEIQVNGACQLNILPHPSNCNLTSLIDLIQQFGRHMVLCVL